MQKNNDSNQTEGEAIRTIINDLIDKGWIYYHQKNNDQYWRIEVLRLNKGSRFNLRIWANSLLKDKRLDLNSTIKISRHQKKDRLIKSITQLLGDDFVSSQRYCPSPSYR